MNAKYQAAAGPGPSPGPRTSWPGTARAWAGLGPGQAGGRLVFCTYLGNHMCGFQGCDSLSRASLSNAVLLYEILVGSMWSFSLYHFVGSLA